MDINRIERRVKKIQTVLDAFREDNRISALEKDLLLGYVRELYDLIRESEHDAYEVKTTVADTKVAAPAQPAAAKAPEVAEVPEYKPKHDKAPEPAVAAAIPVVQEIKSESAEPKAAEKPAVKEPVVTVEAKVEPSVNAPQANDSAAGNYSEEIESIFRMEDITDLSAKLSMSRIDDISKAIGINERIFTINELFGGNGEVFNKMIQKLNSCAQFDQAKDILISEAVIPYGWDKEEKVRKAQQFVKHVRRKFN